MTSEEAKRRLEIEKECMNCDPSRLCYDSYLKPVCENYPFKESHSLEEAIYVAIKALSVEPCEDAISRAAAIKAMDDLEQEDIELYGCSIPEGFDGKRAIEALQSLPSVTPKQKMGRWILQPSNKDQGERDFIWWKCSECGQVIFSESERDRREFHAFCSRCGAKMGDVTDINAGNMSENPTSSNCTACEDTETWNGIHAQITAPKGTFKKIWEEEESEEEIGPDKKG